MKNSIKNATKFIKKIDKKRKDDWSNDTDLLAKYFFRYAKKCSKKSNIDEEIKEEDVEVIDTPTDPDVE